MDDTEQQEWIAGIKERYGIRCIGDEPRAAEVPDWPVGIGPDWQIASEFAMAAPDLVHWYEKPDGMTMAEFLESLPRPTCLPGCNRIDGHDGRDEDACMRDGAPLKPSVFPVVPGLLGLAWL